MLNLLTVDLMFTLYAVCSLVRGMSTWPFRDPPHLEQMSSAQGKSDKHVKATQETWRSLLRLAGRSLPPLWP